MFDGAAASHAGKPPRVAHGPGAVALFKEGGSRGSHLLATGSGRSEGTHNPLRFATRELDRQTGLYYVRARWYDPFLGRFLSEDPIGLAGGINQYAYALNDPVNLSDPSGLHHVCEQTSWGTGSIGEGTYKIHFVSGCWDFGHGPANRFEDGDPPANPSSCLIAGCRLRNPDDQRGERDCVEEALEGIRQDNDFCAEMRARGIAAMYRDLRFWDHPVIYKNPQGRPEQMFGNAPSDARVGVQSCTSMHGT